MKRTFLEGPSQNGGGTWNSNNLGSHDIQPNLTQSVKFERSEDHEARFVSNFEFS